MILMYRQPVASDMNVMSASDMNVIDVDCYVLDDYIIKLLIVSP